MTSQLVKLTQILISRYQSLNLTISGGQTHPLIVGIAGGVSVGKSTFANSIRDELLKLEISSTVISGDSFLMSNSVLASKGLSERKGFPETYYDEDVKQFLQNMRDFDNSQPISIPIYDHVIYDIRSDERQEIPKVAVVLFEGITALRYSDLLDVSIYLDADEEVMKQWYITRWTNYREEIRANPSEFFKSLIHLDEKGFHDLLEHYWVNVNLPNLKQYIEPTKQVANIIVRKANTHEIEDIHLLA